MKTMKIKSENLNLEEKHVEVFLSPSCFLVRDNSNIVNGGDIFCPRTYKDSEKRRQSKKKWRDANREKCRQYNKKWKEGNYNYREKQRIYHKKWIQNHPGYDKTRKKLRPCSRKIWIPSKAQIERKYKKGRLVGSERARHHVYKAIKLGEIPSLSQNYILCSQFGCINRATQYDHRDYNKPLDVTPVCQSCNIKLGPAIPLNTKH